MYEGWEDLPDEVIMQKQKGYMFKMRVLLSVHSKFTDGLGEFYM